MKNNYFYRSLLLLLIVISSAGYSTTYYSRANTAWGTASTWSTAGCGGAAAVSAPTATDDVIICSGYTVTINAASNCRSLTIDGTGNWTSIVTTNVGTGGLTVNPGGNITGTVAAVITTTGGFVLNAALTSTTITIRTITTAGQTISGTGTLARLDISSNTTNNGNITVTTTLASSTPSILTQGASGTLTFNGTTTITPTIDAGTPGNTFIYGGAAQTIKSTTYHHLTISGSATKTLGGAITVNGNLAINAGILSTSTFQVTGNATGNFTMAAGTFMYIGSNASATNVFFPTNFTNAHITLATTSTVNYYGNSAQTISTIPTYGNLTLQTFSGSKIADGAVNVVGNLIATSPSTLNMGTYSLGVRGDFTGTGPLSFTSGNFTIGGNYTNTGAFTCGTGTVNYSGSTAQTVRGVNYYNLTFSNTGDKNLQAAATIGISATFTRGTMTVTPGATSTVTFNGATPIMTGSATTFTNLTITTGTLTAPASFTVNGNLTTTTPGTLVMGANTVNVGGNYAGTGSLSFTSGNLNISGNFSNTGVFTGGTGTVDYNGSITQTVRGVNYNNLTFSGAGAKALQASATIGIAGTFTRGTMTVTPGTSNTVLFNGGVQTMTGSATTFTNLTINNTSLNAPADFTVNSTLSISSPAILQMTSYALNVTGNFTGTGALSFTSGTLTLSAAYSNTGAFTCGTGTVNYAGNAAQTVRGVNYNNLTFSGTGTKTLQAASTIGIAGTFTRGTMTVTPGATNVVLFNGTTQVMTGVATTFTNVTINNTSLTIPVDITINSTLTFTNGTIITNANNVILPATGVVSRTNGHVVGNMRKGVAIGSNVTKTFEIGSSGSYTPLNVIFASVTTAGSLTVATTAGDHASIATSGFNGSLTINRYWTIANSAIVYTTYSATATYVDADKDAGYNTANSLIKMYDGSTWSLTNGALQTANSSQSTGITLPLSSATAYLQIGQIIGSASGNLYSIATGNWSTPGTWSQTSGGVSCSCIPTSLDNVIIENNFIVTMNGNNGVARSLTLQTGGKATWTAALTTNIGSGGINITSTGDITGTALGILATSGGLTLNTTLTSTAVTVRTITTAGQTISGTGTLAKLDISANTTNTGILTVTTTLASTVTSILTQGASATLTYNGTTAIVPVIDGSTAGNTFIYGGTTQTVRSATYHNLTIAGSGAKTLGGVITVNGNLNLNAGSLATSTFQISGNATGIFTMAAATTLFVGSNVSATNVLFPTNFTNAHISCATTSTVNYYGNNAQTVSSVPTYGNLTIQTFSGLKTADGTMNVAGNLTTTSPSTLSMTSNTLNVTGNYAGTGALSFTSGTYNETAAFSNTGTFTCGTGTVNYTGNLAQTIRGVNYNNLTFSGTGAKTLQAAATIGIAGTFARGTMTVTPGATNVVLFNGTTQAMTGNAITFTNLTINNSSLTIPVDITVNSTLTFTAGSIITNTNNVIMAAAGTVARTTGHVIGNLRKNVTIGSNISRTYEVGTSTAYAPLTVLFTTVTTAGNLTASTTAGDHPAIATSGFNSSFTVNRYWTVTNSAIVYNNYTITATFVNGDKDPGYNTTNSILKIYNGSSWSTPTAGSVTANSAQAVTITTPVTPNTIHFQMGDSNPSGTGNLYSIASGNWSAPGTWSQTTGGPNCFCTPTSQNDVVIENNFIVTMDAAPGLAHSLLIQTGGKANWTTATTTNIGASGISITSAGNITGTATGILTTIGGLTLNAALTSTSVTIKTITTPGQIINGSGTLSNLDINTNTTNLGNITLTNLLTITAGILTNSGTFTLKADATKYARIAPVSSLCGTCGFSGNFIIQQYIPARSMATWANLSSPVSNTTMADWDNELYLQYPFGEFDYLINRPGGTNVLAYNEPAASYVESSAATALTPGKGFEIGLTNDNSMSSFSATTLTSIGTPNYGTLDIPLSFTAGNGPAYPIGYSGENLIGNPFASAITVNGLTFTNTLTSVDVYDYTIDNYKTLSGSDIIGPHQGFWVYAQGAGASVTIPESAKSTNTTTNIHRLNSENEHPYLKLTLASADGSHTMASSLEIACDELSTDGFDETDHPYRKSLNPKAPRLTTQADNIALSISTFNSDHTTYSMPLTMQTGINGLYNINVSGLNNITNEFPYILLEDKMTKQSIDLRKYGNYKFAAQALDMKDRFILHFSKSSISTSIATYNANMNVQIWQNGEGTNAIKFNFSSTQNATIEVLDLLGQHIIENIPVEVSDQTVYVTMPEDFHGCYLVNIQTSNGNIVKKFIQR